MGDSPKIGTLQSVILFPVYKVGVDNRSTAQTEIRIGEC